jgi:hypothetical protein
LTSEYEIELQLFSPSICWHKQTSQITQYHTSYIPLQLRTVALKHPITSI